MQTQAESLQNLDPHAEHICVTWLCMANQPESMCTELYFGQLNMVATVEAFELYHWWYGYGMQERALATTCI